MSISKTISKYLAATLFLLLVAGTSFAHPGHGTESADGWSALHYLASLEHVFPIAALALVVIVLVTRVYRSKLRNA